MSRQAVVFRQNGAAPAATRDGGEIAAPLLRWFADHGRRDLPWQRRVSPYRVWLSEIMLQQTRVGTVIPYFERFTRRFPDVEALAAAKLDQVLHLWTGLGYYARARNLRRAAQIIVAEYGGEFPPRLEALAALPGIGPSTAGAILALAFQQPAAILDGNAKRVLARFYAVEGWPGRRETELRLWDLARRNTPRREVAAYTQAIMDLGATVCVRSNPRCEACPLSGLCAAYRQGRQGAYPGKRSKAALPVRRAVFALAVNEAREVLLQRRPAPGLWGGLWCLPEFPGLAQCERWLAERFAAAGEVEALEPLRHTFSHFHLDITPVLVAVRVNARREQDTIHDTSDDLWYRAAGNPAIGMAAPVLGLLRRYLNMNLEV